MIPCLLLLLLRPWVLTLTKPGVEHVQRHTVALLRARNCNQTLVAVVLRFVDLDDTATDLTNFVDFLTTLTNDGTDHVIGYVNLLRQAGTTGAWHLTMHRLMRSAMYLRAGMSNVWRWDMGSVSTCLSSIVRRYRRIRLVRGVWVLGRVGVCGRRRHLAGARIGPTPIVVAVTVVAAGWLREVWHNLHATGDGSNGTTSTSRIRRSSRPAEPVIELLQESAAHIVSSNVHSICDTHNDQGTFRGERQARVRGVQTCPGSFLNLLDACATLSNN